MITLYLFAVSIFTNFGGLATLQAADEASSTPAPQSPAGAPGIQALPRIPEARIPEALEQDPPDSKFLPKPGLYTSAPWTMIVTVPGPTTAAMPTVTPPQKGYTGRTMEPPILLIPREEPSPAR